MYMLGMSNSIGKMGINRNRNNNVISTYVSVTTNIEQMYGHLNNILVVVMRDRVSVIGSQSQ